MDQNGNAAVAYCISWCQQENLASQIPLERTAHSYDVEIAGATAGLRAACSHTIALFAKNITVCLDNEEAAIGLHAEQPNPPSSTQFAELKMLSRTWTQIEREGRRYRERICTDRVNDRPLRNYWK